MSYTALARKWRPRSFAEMVGQEHVLRALTHALDSGRIHHAFLFTGTRGVGKTTVSRLFAKALNCDEGVSSTPCGVCAACTAIDAGRFVDLIEVDAASKTKVDDTRELLDNVQYLPTRGRFKIYLIDEVHMLSTHSFNALLKTLEEPPEHVKFLLATTDPQKLPVTVLSRCLQFNLRRLPVSVIGGRIGTILDAEGIAFEPAAVQLLSRAGDGSLRDALSLLDQLLAFAGGVVTEEGARQMLGTVDRQQVVQIARLLAAKEGASLVAYAQGLREWSVDPAQLLDELATLFTQVALRQVVPDAPPTDETFAPELIAELATAFAPEDLQIHYQIALLGRRDLGLHSDPAVAFSMTLVRMLAFQPGGSGSQPSPGGGSTASRTPPVASPAAPAMTSAPMAAPAAVVPTATPAAAPAGELDAASWAALVASLDIGGGARQLASNCVFLRREGGVVHLALDPAKRVLQSRAFEDKLGQALSRAFGSPLRLSIETREGGADTPARAQIRQADADLQSARDRLAADPAVQALQQRFGGTMLPESVRLTRPEEN